MNAKDKDKLLDLLPQVCAFYKQDFSKFLGSVWLAAMEPYTFAEVNSALTRHSMNPDSGQFMPRPADVVKMLGGTSADMALGAWSKVERAIRSIGQYQSVVFDDPLIHRVIDDMGGWVKVNSYQDEKAFEFAAREFQTRYRGFSMRSEVPSYAPALMGLAASENARMGLSGSSAIRLLMLGDPVCCIEVFKGGGQGNPLQVAQLAGPATLMLPKE